MCLLLIAVDWIPQCPLLLLGNRDEFHARATQAARPWSDAPQIVGGRDQVAGGSWLALREDGRFAAVTNLRTGKPTAAPRSRGWLVRDFVQSQSSPVEFLERVRNGIDEYGPFNLVVGDPSGVFALGSDRRVVQALRSGVHVISNGAIGAQWPKTERLRRSFSALMEGSAQNSTEAQQLDLLLDETPPDDEVLPDTGIGLELERRLAPLFLRGEQYGTRASTLVVGRGPGDWLLRERSFGPDAAFMGEVRWQSRPDGGFRDTPCRD